MQNKRIYISKTYVRENLIKTSLIGVVISFFVILGMPEPFPLNLKLIVLLVVMVIGAVAMFISWKKNKQQFIELEEASVCFQLSRGKQVVGFPPENKPKVNKVGKCWLVEFGSYYQKKLYVKAFPSLKADIDCVYGA